MKFGEIALEEALGAVLAHTLRTESGTLKKGRVLSRPDLEALEKSGHRRVIAARLEAGDLPEDEAASAAAKTIVGPNVDLAAASTGRANLFARVRGVLAIDAEHVHRLNAIDPAITLATSSPYGLVEAGDLIATVKIIPFAVPAAAIERASRLEAGWLRVVELVPHRVGFVQTSTPEMAVGPLDRASENQRARVQHLGSTLLREIRCAHTEDAVAQAFLELLDQGAELLLVLGASATCDARDVIPAAIERIGGRVEHLGMPVDPGNLLLLGDAHGVRVIGVPGCARSLKRSGFDSVLERVLAKIPTTAQDISRMGAGGLLSEIDQRPAPRAGRPRSTPRIAGVVLAAGMSRRMGTNKLLVEVGGAPIVARAVDALLGSKAARVFVVVGHQREAIEAAIAGRDVQIVPNAEYQQGMSASLRAGIASLGTGFDGALIALGDMPLVRPAHIDALINAFDPNGPETIWVPMFEGERGHPVLWSARHFAELQALSGDVGARSVLERHAGRIKAVSIDDEAIHVDVDTPEALREIEGQGVPDEDRP